MANPSYFWLIEEGRTHPKLGCIHKPHRQFLLIFTPSSPLFEFRKEILVLRLKHTFGNPYSLPHVFNVVYGHTLKQWNYLIIAYNFQIWEEETLI